MKIIIGPKESYELEIQPEYPFEDFKILVKKLNVVVSTFSGETSAKQISQGKKPKLSLSREDIIQILRAAFTLELNTPEMEEVLRRYNMTKMTISHYKYQWLTKYNVTAEELGLSELPKAPDNKKE